MQDIPSRPDSGVECGCEGASREYTTPSPPPSRLSEQPGVESQFEPGTPDVAGSVALGLDGVAPTNGVEQQPMLSVDSRLV